MNALEYVTSFYSFLNTHYSELPLKESGWNNNEVLDLRDNSLIQQHSREIKLAEIGGKMAWSLWIEMEVPCVYKLYDSS